MEFLILSFATFWITEAIITTDGPFGVFEKLRHRFEKPFGCFTCLSFWVALVLAAVSAPDIQTWIMCAFGAAGLSLFMDYLSDRF